MIKITQSHEDIIVKNIKILIYGQPGVWKTSLGFTADKPLLLDFDQGAHRSEFRGDTVVIDKWEDVASMDAKDLKGYNTIVVDTVGRLLDFMAFWLMENNPKLSQKSGALTLGGYGELKASYAAWLKKLILFGKDVILIAHDKEDKKGDIHIVRPDIQGGSYGEVFKQADSVGYIYHEAKKNHLCFSPSDSWIGKNIAGFEPLVLPDFHNEPNYLGGVIKDIKKAINAVGAQAKKIRELIVEWEGKVTETADCKTLNTVLAEARKIKTTNVKNQVSQIIANHAKSLDLKYNNNNGAGSYEEQKKEATAEAVPNLD